MTYTVTETCACGASITVEGIGSSWIAKQLTDWREIHFLHARPRPTEAGLDRHRRLRDDRPTEPGETTERLPVVRVPRPSSGTSQPDSRD